MPPLSPHGALTSCHLRWAACLNRQSAISAHASSQHLLHASDPEAHAAVNQQKDIIFDGTMTWAPFVEQTIAMVRDFEHQYRTGPGYHKDDDGNVVER